MVRDRYGRAERPARRTVAALALVTVLVVLLDLAGVAWTSRIRQGGAVVLGPVVRALSGGDAAIDRLTRERDGLADENRRQRAAAEANAGAQDLLENPALAGSRLVPARVVAIGAVAADGAQRLTLDVGSRDGIERDLSVVAGDGLVGRVVEVGPWTSDVLLLGAADVAVGVRVGSAGALGILDGEGSHAQVRAPGELGLALVEAGELRAGDVVTTLGSPNGRPFVAGLRVGTVDRVDPRAGRLTATGIVRPAVDLGTLGVVGVVLPGIRSTPRAPLTPSGTTP